MLPVKMLVAHMDQIGSVVMVLLTRQYLVELPVITWALIFER